MEKAEAKLIWNSAKERWGDELALIITPYCHCLVSADRVVSKINGSGNVSPKYFPIIEKLKDRLKDKL